jgi:hypothetical protein
MRIRYVGPIDSVDIPSLGIRVERNGIVDVRDAETLLAQVDNWAEIEIPAEAKKG